MEYYTITPSTNNKEVGHYIQCKGIIEGETYKWFESPNSMTKLDNDSYPNSKPDLRFELEDKAIFTDLISTSNISAIGLLVSPKLYNLIGSFKLSEHKIYKAEVSKGNQSESYFWIHFVKSDLKGIDLINSVIFLSEFGFDKSKYIEIRDYEEGLSVMRESGDFLNFEKIILASDNSLGEMFFLPIPNKIIASENVAHKLVEGKITGINLEKIK